MFDNKELKEKYHHNLEKPPPTKTDKFLEKFQMAFDSPLPFFGDTLT